MADWWGSLLVRLFRRLLATAIPSVNAVGAVHLCVLPAGAGGLTVV